MFNPEVLVNEIVEFVQLVELGEIVVINVEPEEPPYTAIFFGPLLSRKWSKLMST